MLHTTRDPLKVMFVGRRIRQFRKERGLTQVDLAGRVGILQSDLCRMETGEYRVNLEILSKILVEFNLSPSEFFQENSRSQESWEKELIEDFEKLTPSSRNEIRDFMRFKQVQERNSK